MGADAIIVGGGSGVRFGLKKQFISLGGVPLIRRTVTPFETYPDIDRIVVAVPKDDVALTLKILEDVRKPLVVTAGGKTRQESVWNGLMCAKESTLVLIHDGVRPFATAGLISRVLSGIEGFDACIPGLAVSNTLKKVEGGEVVHTVSRSGLYAVQTPQCFRTEKIIEAHASARKRGDLDATDDSALMEASGFSVRLVEGDALNMKITVKQDLDIAEAILKCRTE